MQVGAKRAKLTLTLFRNLKSHTKASQNIAQASWIARYRSGLAGLENRWIARLFVSRLANAQSRLALSQFDG